MADILFVAILIAFFALAALFVIACDRVIGPDVDVVPTPESRAEEDDTQRAAA